MKKASFLPLLCVSMILLSCAQKKQAIFKEASISGHDHFSNVVATMDEEKETAVISYLDSFSSEPAKVAFSEKRETSRTAKDSIGVSHTYEDRYQYFKVALSEDEGKSLFPLMEKDIPVVVENHEIKGILLCELSKYYDGKIRSAATVAKPIEYYLCAVLGDGSFYNGNSLGTLEPKN